MAQGISQNGGELKGFLQLRSSLSSSAALQKVYCELSTRRLEVRPPARIVVVTESAFLVLCLSCLRTMHHVWGCILTRGMG